MKRIFSIFLIVLLVFGLTLTVSAAGEEPSAQESPNIWVSLVIGLVIALIVILVMRSCMNTKRPQRSARQYLVSGTYRLDVAQDFYLYSRVTRIARPKNNSSGRRG